MKPNCPILPATSSKLLVLVREGVCSEHIPPNRGGKMSFIRPELKAKVDDLIEKAEQGGLVRHMSTLLPILKNLSLFRIAVSVCFQNVCVQVQVLGLFLEPSLLSNLHAGWFHETVHIVFMGYIRFAIC